VIVEEFEKVRRRCVDAGLGVGNRVGDGHEDGGGCAVACDVGDEESPCATVEREEVVIVAAGAGAGQIMSGDRQSRDVGEVLRE
jgi:hypothetical protein